ncbi:bifunctional methylenetetrahydrofolate dehydrogenase/cyclohydrolase, mitochondrial isoform X1 [Toxorhynchites rutilus septentrionalis]|uniref:bifunctional methylenetetrahydrofolate dehydrogenase/cyclohydrolase, mitochondrial isoform X1 n=2 Tax=Toxorhynchites rutilus septentrionalis TaxID=329112 RepID=UPI002478A2AB|nr:bifunctional methylenetetrahydrofolate dehydrogenase/cyclohydrolase, mitochondrial isoform X1 [Toxorhynchites rutilus septentrionalis]
MIMMMMMQTTTLTLAGSLMTATTQLHIIRNLTNAKLRRRSLTISSSNRAAEANGYGGENKSFVRRVNIWHFQVISDNSRTGLGSAQQNFSYFSRRSSGFINQTKMVHTNSNNCLLGTNEADILTLDKHYPLATKDSCIQMAKLIDGKKIASDIRVELREQIEEWMKQGNRAPQLTAILIGEDPASSTYVANKMKAAADVGINSKTERYGSDITEEQLLKRIEELNEDDSVDGILVQLPVPGHINERRVCNSISCDKDVDGFNERNVGRLCLDMNTLIPCTPLGVQELIKRSQIETFGKNAVVVGRSKNVGMPIAMLLHADGRNDTCAMDANVTICHRFTPQEELTRFCRTADIIVTATGVPGLIKADMVKEGAAVIDVGITRVTDPVTGKNKLVGDVDFEEVRKVAGHITPVPGGVGPMTVAMLMKNTFIAAKNLTGKKN